MRLTCLHIALLLFNVGCGKQLSDMFNMGKSPYKKRSSDPAFDSYVKAFSNEFKVRVSVPVIFNNIENNIAGVCRIWYDGYRQIEINSKYWFSFSEEQKEQLIYHELGHCVFKLGHDDSMLTTDKKCPNSIMRSFMFNAFEIDSCYIPKYEHYMEDLNAKR